MNVKSCPTYVAQPLHHFPVRITYLIWDHNNTAAKFVVQLVFWWVDLQYFLFPD